MRVFNIYFSPTGGTKQCASLLLAAFSSSDICEIDLSSNSFDFSSVSLSSEDIAFISVPAFSGRIPAIAVQRLSKIVPASTRCVLMVVYGNRAYDDALVELQDVSISQGFVPVAAVSAIASHSRDKNRIAPGRPDTSDSSLLLSYSHKLYLRLSDNCAPSSICLNSTLPGNRPYRTLIQKPSKIITSDQCIHCGLCADLCPVGCIDVNNPANFDMSLCFSCMRCISCCPTGCKQIAPEEMNKILSRLVPLCSVRKEPELFL